MEPRRSASLDLYKIGQQAKRSLFNVRLMEGDGKLPGDVGIELDRHRETIDGVERIIRADLNRRPTCAEGADRGQRPDPHATASGLVGSGRHLFCDRLQPDRVEL